MTPEAFIAKWRGVELSERAASQDHFNELCALLDVKKPTDADSLGVWFTFEKPVPGGGKGGGGGFADVWRKDCFVWEYKRRKKPREAAEEKGKPEYRTIAAALAQARDYAALLENPPLVIACDIDQIVVRTLFTGSVSVTHTIKLIDLNDSAQRDLLRRCFTDPASLRPEITPQAVTEQAATKLASLAQTLRERRDRIGQAHDPRRVAHFLNKIVFCLFAEDSGLLPGGVFSAIIEEAQRDHAGLTTMLADLFDGMRHGKRRFGTVQIPWFNGGLFDDDDVLDLQFSEVRLLGDAARLDWASIDPTIFGTLFERGLDPAKRKEMANLFDAAASKVSRRGTANQSTADFANTLPLRGGANPAQRSLGKGVGIHYTESSMIMKIVEPVVLRPLAREWEAVVAAIAQLKTKAAKDQRYLKFRERLGAFRVLDPACGSGNFLYLALRHLKDFDQRVEHDARELGLTLDPKGERITPATVLGIEVNPYAAELARVTIWIGELQWQMRLRANINRRPILGALDGIENRDALVDAKSGREARWPRADVIVGNPPFLGNKLWLRRLGESYSESIRSIYGDRLPGTADLVVYWVQKAYELCSSGAIDGFGFVTTKSVAKGSSRVPLDRVVESPNLIVTDAWRNEPWTLGGAQVRVSMFCVMRRSRVDPKNVRLDGHKVASIFADLSSGDRGFDLPKSKRLSENRRVAFQGIKAVGDFDMKGGAARALLVAQGNPHQKSNAAVIRQYFDVDDVVSRPADGWIIDFGVEMSIEDASLFEAPFRIVERTVKPHRDSARRANHRDRWWIRGEARPGFRRAVQSLRRYLIVPETSKYLLFRWVESSALPSGSLFAIARDDDTSMGILQSGIHGRWAADQGNRLGVGNERRYNIGMTLETFPFPEGLTPNIPAKKYEQTPHARRIAKAAHILDERRESWLNPPELVRRVPEVIPSYPDRLIPANARAEASLKERTLTRLYNERPTWLALAHRDLDRAIAAAYGWDETLADRAQPENPDTADRKAAEEEILAKLFALNQERAAQGR